jgi:hypothetical protein
LGSLSFQLIRLSSLAEPEADLESTPFFLMISNWISDILTLLNTQFYCYHPEQYQWLAEHLQCHSRHRHSPGSPASQRDKLRTPASHPARRKTPSRSNLQRQQPEQSFHTDSHTLIIALFKDSVLSWRLLFICAFPRNLLYFRCISHSKGVNLMPSTLSGNSEKSQNRSIWGKHGRLP